MCDMFWWMNVGVGSGFGQERGEGGKFIGSMVNYRAAKVGGGVGV